MHGKVVVITGATSGIGQVAAEELAEQGARMVLIARDRPGRGDVGALAGPAPGVSAWRPPRRPVAASRNQRVAAEIAAAEPRIDLLLNNAGALFDPRKVTEDGLEFTFATNHMAYFLLT